MFTGMLYPDDGQSFESVLYYGNEWLLFTWDVILLSTIDYWSGSFVLSAVVAWIFNEVSIIIGQLIGLLKTNYCLIIWFVP